MVSAPESAGWIKVKYQVRLGWLRTVQAAADQFRVIKLECPDPPRMAPERADLLARLNVPCPTGLAPRANKPTIPPYIQILMVASYDPVARMLSSSWRHVTPLVWPFNVRTEHRPYFQLYPTYPDDQHRSSPGERSGRRNLTCHRSLYTAFQLRVLGSSLGGLSRH